MDFFLIATTISAMTVAVIEDLRRMKIPNIVTFPTMIVAITYHCLTSGLYGFWFSAGGLALGMGLFIVPYILGGMGAGDVKLMGAIGASFGPKGILIASMLVISAGGIYGLILFALNFGYTADLFKRLWSTFKTFVLTRQLIIIPPDANRKMPALRYAIPIALGAGCYLFMKITGYDLFPELLGDRFQVLSIASI